MRVCVIDHRQLFRQTTCEFLCELGEEVCSFEAVTGLVERADEGALPVDVIIAQLPLAGAAMVSSLELIQRVAVNAVVIVVASAAPRLPASRAFELGVWAYLREPVWFTELELLLLRLREQRSGIRQGRASRAPRPEAGVIAPEL